MHQLRLKWALMINQIVIWNIFQGITKRMYLFSFKSAWNASDTCLYFIPNPLMTIVTFNIIAVINGRLIHYASKSLLFALSFIANESKDEWI